MIPTRTLFKKKKKKYTWKYINKNKYILLKIKKKM